MLAAAGLIVQDLFTFPFYSKWYSGEKVWALHDKLVEVGAAKQVLPLLLAFEIPFIQKAINGERIASSNGVSRNAGSRIYFRITLPKRKLYKVVKIEIAKSALLDIQPALLCACGVESFSPHLPGLEHLIGKPLNVCTFSIPQQTRKPVGELLGASLSK